MRSVYTIWRMMARRNLANWRLATTLVLGVLVAATLLAAAPIYARSMADLGVTFSIRDKLRTTPATRIELLNQPITSEDGRNMQDAVSRRIEERIGWFSANRERVILGPRFAAAPEGGTPVVTGPRPNELSPVVAAEFLTGVEDNVRVLDGRLPQPATDPDGRPLLEIAISAKSAESSGFKLGDRLSLAEYYDDCAREIPREDRPPPPPCTPRLGLRLALTAQVVGLVEPVDPDGSFWVLGARAYFDPYRLTPELGVILPAFTDEQALRAVLSGAAADYRGSLTWNVFTDPQKLSRANYLRARDDIVALREDLRAVNGFAYSPLEGVLEGFNRELRFQQAPLLILLLQIAAIALFYVAVISTMVVERQSDEIALLRSRGAGRLQVAGLYLLEGLTIGVPVTLVAPLLAGLVTALLGLTPNFKRVTGGDALPVHIGPEAFALAALGAALSLLMLIGPAFLAASLTGVTARRRRAETSPSFARRYYLDLAVVALAGLLLWELSERGSVFTPAATGGVSSDPLLLVSPALLTLAAAALVLRFYPILLRIAAGLFGAVVGVPVALGLWQVVRNPGQYTRLALLLMMAVAVGTFAASYSSTAERSVRDRARFESGVDLRGSSRGLDATPAEIAQLPSKFPDVEVASSVVRDRVTAATPGSGRLEMTLLGVDPDAAANLLWFRSDLADESLPALMSHLRGAAARGKVLPGSPAAVSIWVNPAEPRENVTMWVRVRDATGYTGMYELGKLDFKGWRQLRAPLAGKFLRDLAPPAAIVSIVLSEPPNINSVQTSPVYIDDIAVEEGGRETVVEDFEGTPQWQAMPSPVPARGGAVQDDFKIASEQAHSGSGAGRFAFRQGATTGLRGIYVTDPNIPLPVVVSPSFVAETGAGVGQSTLVQVNDAIIPVVVRGVGRLFPTIPSDAAFVLFNRDQVMAWAATFSDGTLRTPNEVWMRLRAGADREATKRALLTSSYRFDSLNDQQETLASIDANPLIAAGGGGILVVAFIGLFALVGVALLVTLVASVQRRRTEFAVMRAMGLARGQIFRLLAFEYTLVAVLGVVVGVYLGRLIGRRMLSFLDVTQNGLKVSPPFILQTNWTMVAAAVGAVVLVFLAGMTLSTRTVEHQSGGQALRQTE